MYYTVESAKTFHEGCSALEKAVVHHGFGVLHTHDMGKILRSKGIPFSEECRIFEVCNPQKAAEVLNHDLRLNMILPCRISVYTQNGKTTFGLLKPVDMLRTLTQDSSLSEVAFAVEKALSRMVDEAADS